MKKILFLWAMACMVSTAFAQEVYSLPPRDFRNVLDSVFISLDKTDITTGLLEEKGGA